MKEGQRHKESKTERDERFVQAVREHREAMYRVALSMLRSKADAEDAVSEATVQAYAHLDALKSWDAVRAWLMRITVNACHATLRRRKREMPRAFEEADLVLPEPESRVPVWAYVAKLPPKYACVLQMVYGEGMSVEEIAQLLRLPKGTVSSRMTRGRRMLKEQIEKEENLR